MIRRAVAWVALASAGVVVAGESPIDPSTLTEPQRAAYEEGLRRGSVLDDETAVRNADDRLLKRVIDAQTAAERDGVGIDTQAVEARAAQYNEQAQAIANERAPKDFPDLKAMLDGHPYADEVNSLMEGMGENEPPPAKYALLVSRAMGHSSLQQALTLARDRQDVVLVFRGIVEGETIPELVQYIAGIVQPKEGEALPNVTINPLLFEGDPPVAPTLLRLDQDGKVIAQVRGILNPDWIEARVESGQTGDLGRMGETTAVVEQDLIKVLQAKLADYDMEGATKRAYENYFADVSLPVLETAVEDRTREFDPSVIIEDAITGPDGTVLAYPGTVINPMDAAPFNMTMVFFDARDPVQVAWAREQVVQREGETVYPVMTEVNREEGWVGYGNVVAAIGRHVFHANAMMISRLGVERVPCTVEGGDNRKLVIREYALAEERNQSREQGGSNHGTGRR